MTKGRIVAITGLALAMGFVAGAWLVGSGVAVPFVPPAAATLPNNGPGGTPPAPPARGPQFEREEDVAEADFPGTSSGLSPQAERTDLLPSPGCTWVIAPRKFELGRLWNWNDAGHVLCGYSGIEPPNGPFNYLLLQSTSTTGALLELRPVFFDAEGNRYVPRKGGTGTGSGSGLGGASVSTQFWLDPRKRLRPSEIAYVGIEKVAPGAAQILVAASQQEARDKGMAILPSPQVGAPYVFDLPTAGGERVASAGLRGKAVVVAVFDPTCRSYAQATLRKLRETNPPGDLALVAVYFDGPDEDARETLRQALADEALVVVEDKPSARRLWSDGAGLDWLPKYFLVDRAGVLRHTSGELVKGSPTTIEYQVDVLFGRAPSTPPGGPVWGRHKSSSPKNIIPQRPKAPAKTP